MSAFLSLFFLLFTLVYFLCVRLRAGALYRFNKKEVAFELLLLPNITTTIIAILSIRAHPARRL